VNPIFYFTLFLAFETHAGPIRGGGASDPATYEAITGESAEEDKAVWDSFYKNKKYLNHEAPIEFLKDQLHLIPKGRAFVPAMGEGRNAIYLAKKGYTVDGNDISDTAVDRAMESAKLAHVRLNGKVADLLKVNYQNEYYDLIVISQFYVDSLMPKFKKSLKRGGYILIYERLDTGKPQKQRTPDDFFVKASILKNAVKDLEIKVYREFKVQDSDALGILARKP
jgi:tellurite methyltransferase